MFFEDSVESYSIIILATSLIGKSVLLRLAMTRIYPKLQQIIDLIFN